MRPPPLEDPYNHFVVAMDPAPSSAGALVVAPPGTISLSEEQLRRVPAGATVMRADDGSFVVAGARAPAAGPAVDPPWADHPGMIEVAAVAPGVVRVSTTLSRGEVAALPGVAAVESDRRLQGFDDPMMGNQWALENDGRPIGGVTGVVDADVDATTGWASSQGDGIVVAVIDTGFDLAHPDLAGAYWSNAGEICGNSTDDDGNGYVDDCAGWDFHENDGNVGGIGSTSHGTHIAGIIAARRDNGIGVAGVAPQATIMPLKAGANSTIWFSAATAAVDYAVANGADVISASFGSAPGQYGSGGPLQDAVARAEAEGVIFVAAAGNAGANIDAAPVWPASIPLSNVVTVGSSTNTDARSGFSNYGAQTVELFAPGSFILSTLPGGGYGGMSGTSMAAPYVAGVAALFLSENPAAGWRSAVDRLLSTAEDRPALAGLARRGRLNVGDANSAVSFDVAGVGAGVADTESELGVVGMLHKPKLVPPDLPLAYRASLAIWLDGSWQAVVEHPLTIGDSTVTTDEEGAAIVTPAPFTLSSAPALLADGHAASLGVTLPPGTYALMAELVDAADPDRRFGRPSAVSFVMAPAATPPPEAAPGEPAAPGQPPPPGEPAAPAPPPATAPGPGTPAPAPAPPPTTAPPAPAPGTPSPTSVPTVPGTPAPGTPAPAPAPVPSPAAPQPPPSSPAPSPVLPGSPAPAPAPAPAGPSPTSPPPPASSPTQPPPSPAQPPPTVAPPSPAPLGPDPTAPPPAAPLPPPAPPSDGPFRLTAVTPRSGPTTGRTLIMITGSNLPERAYVWVGGQPAPVVASGPDGIIATTSPHATPGTYDVEVVAPDGTRDALRGAFTYVAVETDPPPPTETPAPTTPPSTTPPPPPPPPQVRQLANGLKVKVLPDGSPLAGFRPTATCAAPTCRATLI